VRTSTGWSTEVIAISAAQDQGIPDLMRALLKHIPPGPKYYSSDTLTTRDERFFTSEIIRECLLKLYKVRCAFALVFAEVCCSMGTRQNASRALPLTDRNAVRSPYVF
jgi:putative protein kinase ArgK-like GTPase of G3E family